MNITPFANISGTAGRGRPVRHPGRNFFPPRGETQTTEEFLMKKASTGTGPCSGGAGAVPEISASARGSRAGASAALRGGSPGGSVARRRRRRRRKGTHESRGGMAGAGSICVRRCHDCGNRHPITAVRRVSPHGGRHTGFRRMWTTRTTNMPISAHVSVMTPSGARGHEHALVQAHDGLGRR